MTKFKASFVHLLISALFVALFFLFVYFVWYQQIYFEISGVFTPMKILFVVDVVLGPLLTFIVYKEGKKHMKLDFILIALFQLLAFSYGAYSVFLGKPSLVIHRTGYMEVMLEKHVDYALLNDEMKSQNYLFFPVYGKVTSENLMVFSPIKEKMAEVTLFDDKDINSFTNPLSVEDAQNTFNNSEQSVQKEFQSFVEQEQNVLFYELKFDPIYTVIVINKHDASFDRVLVP